MHRRWGEGTFNEKALGRRDILKSLLVLLLLLIPQVNYFIYYALSSLILFLVYFRGSISLNSYSKVVLLVIVYLITISIMRVFLVQDENIKDFVELAKLLPLVMVLLLASRLKDITIKHFSLAIFVYILLDGIVTYTQFFRLDDYFVFNFLSGIYNNPLHVERSMGWSSRRALGLSSGPADHGAIMVFCFVVMISLFLYYDKLKKISFIGVVVSFTIIFLSQSKTAIVTSIAILPVFFLYYLISRELSVKRMMLIACVFTLLLGSIVIFMAQELEQFEKLLGLFGNGSGGISSFSARLDKWSEYLGMAGQNPFWQLIGFGRTYMGEAGRVFDNDYVYMYFVHGFLFFIFVFSSIVVFLFRKTIYWKQESIENKMLAFLLTSGLLFSTSAAFLTSPRVTMLFALLIAIKHHSDKKKQIQFGCLNVTK